MAEIKIAFDKFMNGTEKTGNITNAVDVLSLFPDSFMKTYTRYNSLVEFIEASGLDFLSQKDWDKLQNGSINSFIKSNSDFESWADMLETAHHFLKSSML